MTKVTHIPLTRRQLIGYSAALSAGLIVSSASAGRASIPALAPGTSPAASPSAFTKPPRDVAPRFRWWWPNGEVDIAEITREVDQVADAGFGGLEIANVHHGINGSLWDLENYGWGSPRWIEAVEAAYSQAEARGITLDLTAGPSWPAAVPTITPQSDSAIKELAHGVVELAGGQQHSGPVPAPVQPAEHGVTDLTLLAVHAIQIVSKPAKPPMVVKRSTLVDLTDQVSSGAISWTAPEGSASWVLVAYWVRGSGQEAEGGYHTSPTSYVVDHFSHEGAQAVIDFWEGTLLTDRLRALLSKAGATFFEDSLEIETKSTIWTPRLEQEFETRVGYALRPFLPIVIELSEKYVFDFDDIINTRVRDDFNQVLSDLYTEHHLVPLRDWAHTLGLKYRVQAYGLEQDSIDQAGVVDIIETESLGAKNLDDYRVLASGRDLAGHTVLSCEAAAYLGKAYNTTWNQVLQTLGEAYCGGVNLAVLHGFAYADAPQVKWPGFAAFSPYYNNAIGYSEAWGPRTPNWKHAADVSAFLTRTQQILQTGKAYYDIVFLRQKGWAQTGIGSPWGTATGIPLGWTQGFAALSSLSRERAIVAGGRFAPDGGNYKAIIVDIDRFRGNEATLSVSAAETLLSFADNGLPIVLFGNWDNPQAVGYRDAAENSRVAELVGQLKARPTVALAPNIPDIGTALAALGVTSDVVHEASNLKHIRRVDGEIDYYYLTNSRHNPAKDKLVAIDQEVTLTAASRRSVPFQLDAWTGKVTPVAQYARSGNRITVRVALAPSQSTVIVLGPVKWAGTPAPGVSVESTNAASARYNAGSIELTAKSAGTYTAALSTGRTKTVKVAALPAAIPLTGWALGVDDWRPGATATQTDHVAQSFQLTSLAPWQQIPGLEDSSGIGDYRTTFTLGKDWKLGRIGVVIDLGVVSDTFRVWVNSRLVTTRDLMDTRVDISDYVRPGSNNLRVEVTTTLLNRLRVSNQTVYGVATRQNYGLVGPVSVQPYGIARVY